MPASIANKLFTDLKKAKIVSGDNPPGVASIGYLLLRSRKVRVLLYVRIATARANGLFSKLARLRLNRVHYIDIGPNILIGDGFMMPHPVNIVIGGNTIIGDDVTVAQNVTIGGNFKRVRDFGGEQRKMPILGDRVWIASGAVIAGPVVIGDDVIIGANSVVTKDIPSNSMVYGQNCVSHKTIEVGDGAYSVITTRA